jgi:hypothetical protein
MKATLGVVFDGTLLIPVDKGTQKALKIALRDPTIPKEVRSWMAENFSALISLVRALGSAKETWIRIPLDGEWMFV